MLYYMKILNQKTLKIIFLVKYLTIKQMIYYEQMYTRFLNFANNRCWQYYIGLTLLQ